MGLGLLDVRTELDVPKVCRQVRATSLLHDLEQSASICGYEIRMGRTSRGDVRPCFRIEASELSVGTTMAMKARSVRMVVSGVPAFMDYLIRRASAGVG